MFFKCLINILQWAFYPASSFTHGSIGQLGSRVFVIALGWSSSSFAATLKACIHFGFLLRLSTKASALPQKKKTKASVAITLSCLMIHVTRSFSFYIAHTCAFHLACMTSTHVLILSIPIRRGTTKDEDGLGLPSQDSRSIYSPPPNIFYMHVSHFLNT